MHGKSGTHTSSSVFLRLCHQCADAYLEQPARLGVPCLQAVRQGIPNIHYLQLDTSNYDNYYAWCDGHPSAVADKAIAQQLASFVGVVQPEWGKPAPVDITVDQVRQILKDCEGVIMLHVCLFNTQGIEIYTTLHRTREL